jgi:MarR family transcriptional regulator, lower aerobic nicotinate degradation pathway regulator
MAGWFNLKPSNNFSSHHRSCRMSQKLSSANEVPTSHKGPKRRAGGTLANARAKAEPAFVVEEQVGFLLRAASQRNNEVFAQHMVNGLTRVQFATMAKLLEISSCSQNELGRLVLLDRASIKEVVSRLRKRGFIHVRPDALDRRQHILSLTELGRRTIRRGIALAPRITNKMLELLNAEESKEVLRLLQKMVLKTTRVADR